MIRQYHEQDFGRLVELMNEFGDFLVEVDNLGRSRREAEFGDYFVRKMLSDVGQNGLVVVIAETEGKLVGFAAGTVEEPTHYDHLQTVASRSGRITELFVTKRFRGQRLGSQLMDQLEVHFRSMGCDVMRVEVFEPNEPAHDFYRARGYSDRLFDMIKKL